jgi:hypothetical protein
MVTTRKTLLDVYAVLRRHLAPATITAVLSDLQRVEGYRSFQDTIDELDRMQDQAMHPQPGSLPRALARVRLCWPTGGRHFHRASAVGVFAARVTADWTRRAGL